MVVDVNIGVIGTVGVPARYGGFETLAEQLAHGISSDQHNLILYCQRSAYPELSSATPFNGHRRVFVPMRANGASSMVHDALAMIHAALIARVDAMLVLGYSGGWFLPVLRLLRPQMRIVTNVDGMEWRRDKFSRGARVLLRTLEWFAMRFSHRIIADNAALVSLIAKLYRVDATMIAYGGDHTLVEPLHTGAIPPGYALSIARIEPENNSHLILAAFEGSGIRLVSVGNWSNSDYSRRLKVKYGDVANINLLDPIYDLSILTGLRMNASFYVHGHSVGGTNPSLVEALFHHDRLLAFDCVFNRATLDEAGGYFLNADTLRAQAQNPESGYIAAEPLARLQDRYRWREIVGSYLATIID